jgi:hypothetical protein
VKGLDAHRQNAPQRLARQSSRGAGSNPAQPPMSSDPALQAERNYNLISQAIWWRSWDGDLTRLPFSARGALSSLFTPDDIYKVPMSDLLAAAELLAEDLEARVV